jgi:CDP-glucose 4,6-dehydratase
MSDISTGLLRISRILSSPVNKKPLQPVFDWTARRMMVTGADGFVGRWLTQALAERGTKVTALMWSGSDDAQVEERLRATGAAVVRGDVTDLGFMSRAMRDAGIDTVFHLAANNTNRGAGLSPYEVFETNIRGTYTVLEACRNASAGTRAIVSSSKEVEDCFRPECGRKHHPYMTSKASAELIARTYGDTFGVPVTVVRSDNIYGGGDFNWQRLVPGATRSLLQGEAPVIRSSGRLQRDYVYVEDAVAAYLAIAERLDRPDVAGKLFRVATGATASALDVLSHLVRLAGRADLGPRVLNEAQDERVDIPYMPVLEKNVLGWTCRVVLRDGLARAYAWYLDFFKAK